MCCCFGNKTGNGSQTVFLTESPNLGKQVVIHFSILNIEKIEGIPFHFVVDRTNSRELVVREHVHVKHEMQYLVTQNQSYCKAIRRCDAGTHLPRDFTVLDAQQLLL